MASHGSAHHGDGFTGRSRCRSEITIASWAATGATRRRAQRFPGSDSKETIMTIAKPNMHPFILATCAAALLAACNDKNEAAEDKLERAAETSATGAGPLRSEESRVGTECGRQGRTRGD